MKNHKYKKWFGAFVLVTVVLFSSFGCITKAVWRDDYIPTNYHETILAFYSNVKAQNIAFIGEKFHYIFDKQTTTFIQLLANRDFLNLQQENLQLHTYVGRPNDSDIEAHISVHFKESQLNNQQKSWLLSHNYHQLQMPTPYIREDGKDYRPIEDTGEKVYSMSYDIQGKRYLVNTKVNTTIAKLERVIPLEITEFRKDNSDIIQKIAMTPLSVTADAVGGVLLLAGAIVMFPIVGIASLFN